MDNTSSDHINELPTELLEHTLHYLRIKDLLFAQQVCRRWKEVIESSKKLQQALFMVPEEPSEGWICTDIKQYGTTIGLRVDAVASKRWQRYSSDFLSYRSIERALQSDPSVICRQTFCTRGRVNELFAHANDDSDIDIEDDLFWTEGYMNTIIDFPKSPFAKLPSKYHKMLLVQPPMVELEGEMIFNLEHHPGKDTHVAGPSCTSRNVHPGEVVPGINNRDGPYYADVYATVRKSDGITLGHFLDAFKLAETDRWAGASWQTGWLGQVGHNPFCPSPADELQLLELAAEEQGMERLSTASKKEVWAMIHGE